MRLLLALALCLLALSARAAEPLPRLRLAPEVTVSGLSSGAFMTVQLQVDFSQTITGVGVVAGGPYYCALSSVWEALGTCLNSLGWWWWNQTGPAVGTSLDAIEAVSSADNPTDLIAPDRIYLFHGLADQTVRRETMDALLRAYRILGVDTANVEYVGNVEAGHGFLSPQGEVPCAETRANFINSCKNPDNEALIDQAGDILNWLYPDLSPAGDASEQNLMEFDQGLYTQAALGMDNIGLVYIPDKCKPEAQQADDSTTCRLHIALHGCQQGIGTVGDAYARQTGYNRWAEANNIVVLYPQAAVVASSWFGPFSGNPKGCWDWWGYSGNDYLSREAPQIAAIARMAAALGAPLERGGN